MYAGYVLLGDGPWNCKFLHYAQQMIRSILDCIALTMLHCMLLGKVVGPSELILALGGNSFLSLLCIWGGLFSVSLWWTTRQQVVVYSSIKARPHRSQRLGKLIIWKWIFCNSAWTGWLVWSGLPSHNIRHLLYQRIVIPNSIVNCHCLCCVVKAHSKRHLRGSIAT